MKRFLFHHKSDTVPTVTMDWECVEFSNKQIAVSLVEKVLSFHTLETMVERFASIGSVAIEWIDAEVKHDKA